MLGIALVWGFQTDRFTSTQRTATIVYQSAVQPAQMEYVELLTHAHATVVIPKIQRTARIVYQYAFHPAPMEYVQLLTHVHATVVTPKIQRTARNVYQSAV